MADVRTHGTTGQRPINRLRALGLRPLPEFLPDYRDTASAKVYSDFSSRFDANTFAVPPWAIGKQVIVKADHRTLTVYLRGKVIGTHPRSYKRKELIELPAHKEAALRQKRRLWRTEQIQAFISLGEEAKTYLERLSTTHGPLKKTSKNSSYSKTKCGRYALIDTIKRATIHNAYGAHYTENILYKQKTPKTHHPRSSSPLLTALTAILPRVKKYPGIAS